MSQRAPLERNSPALWRAVLPRREDTLCGPSRQGMSRGLWLILKTSGVISSVPTVMGSQSSISCCNPLSDTVPTYSQDPFSGGRQKVPQPPRVQTSYTGKGLLRAFGCSSNSTCQTDDRANVQISGDYVRNCI